ncbi:leucine-rich repeat-containing protein 27 isoform X2 [Nematostella vectensis]|uniref:leucine-rich repeat-containing protein 27 isoform X2 n=1 Tax=Nematostella vectensis TaxID=45351 RepID=UPI0020775E46|nr:leucine-rich repeat-containing protein 27 isoform X2 [Nematostella vectensis]
MTRNTARIVYMKCFSSRSAKIRVQKSDKMAVGDGVEQLLSTAAALGTTTLDLNRKNLIEIPPKVLDLQHLEFLYLEGNYLTTLPETLFERLPNLKWLDLRNNHINEVPENLGAHRCLKNLLLEGNNIRTLPFELGFIKSLSGLNLASNPLENPPPQVVEKGTQEVLRFLREQFSDREKASGHCTQVKSLSASSSDEDLSNPREFSSQGNSSRRNSTGSIQSRRYSKTRESLEDDPDLRPIQTPVSFHTPPLVRPDQVRKKYDRQRSHAYSAESKDSGRRHSYGENASHSWEKASSTGSAPSKRTQPRHRHTNPKLEKAKYDIHDPPKFPDFEAKIAEQQQMAMDASLNEKENGIVQKLKDKKALDDWRDKTKRIRQRKQHLASFKAPVQPDVNAPYGTEKNMKEEKPNAMYVAKLKELLGEKDKGAARRALLDRELEDRIRMHMDKIQDHRRKTYDNIQDELESARRNLEMAHKYQRELDERKALEYRLRAFTGDDIALAKGNVQQRLSSKKSNK